MPYLQKIVSIAGKKRGCHLITSDITKQIDSDLSKFNVGIANLFIQHTSASLTINENYDPDVLKDMEDAMNRIVPEDNKLYRHTMEGSDDMPAHVKTTLVGPSLNIPITKGKLNLGTWQGIYLWEHRNHGGTRNILSQCMENN